MSPIFNKLFALSLTLLTAFELNSCAPQSYYPYSTPYVPVRPYAARAANPYRRADYSPYSDYNREYYEALKQRRMRALADSYRGIYNDGNSGSSSNSISSGSSASSDSNGNSKTQSYYSYTPLPAASAANSASVSSDGSSSNRNYNTNYNRNQAYALYNRQAYNTAAAVSALTNPQQDATTTTTTTSKPPTSKADEQNAKFGGLRNQEANDEENSKTAALLLKHKKFRRRCLPFGRALRGGDNSVTPPPEEQGRILWDLNVYNIYSGGYPAPVYGDSGCGGGFGGGGGLASAFASAGAGPFGGLGGGGFFSDPLDGAYAPPPRPLNNLLQLFAPGILQNALAATARPAFRPQSDPGSNEVDPDVEANYNPVPARPPPPVRRPNRVYYDSAGAAPITPAQLVGGVATTVNGIIQQLTGNVQPVYPSYRSQSYGK